jgi:hypothetical protein
VDVRRQMVKINLSLKGAEGERIRRKLAVIMEKTH